MRERVAALGRAFRPAAGRAQDRARDARRTLRAFADEAARVAAGRRGGRMAVPAADEDLARVARTINDTLERLEHALDQQRQFASDASHELRTPVTGLRTRIEVALADPGDTDLLATLGDALSDAERLQRIVDDLLALARLDAGTAPLRTPLDLTCLVRGELAGHPERVPVRDRLQNGVYVRVDRLQMCRVLIALLSNADRHAAEQIEVRLRTDGDDAVLEVCDDGPGIASGDRERVFERFARVDTARSRAAGGSGLGLAVAREIVLAHGGRLYVGPSERGARLILRLPLDRGEGTAPGRPERGVLRPPVPAAPRSQRE
ncbi:sensor histidine kinase [Actinomadura sp. 9N407]|uniref:sensor histidine kinase n=1 Tax=Actinomadura sp. 9N407 TaxID=3375154 RepID=UPI0037B64AA5